MRTKIFLVPVVFLFTCSAVLAEATIPVDIKADNLKYYEATGLVEASGSVEVKLKDVTIRADRLLMDERTNVATAEGNVRLAASDYSAVSDTLVYNADTETSNFSNFKVGLTPPNLSGPLYVDAKNFTDLKNKMTGGPAEITTCDRAEPHFFLLADKISYYPNDHLDGRNVTLIVGEAPVFFLPYFYYDLHEQRRKNWSFGHNE
ncbi:MAG: LptA/OstA family protein, partial [Candidatus Margulisbacteria bacterium]|nr:LptA/OstA family protein [Candidatus Margulisiibacteriota bacterium]